MSRKTQHKNLKISKSAQIQDLLQSFDPEREYSKSSIFSCELRVLKSLDFRLPRCLPISVIELFLAHTDLARKPRLRGTCLLLLDIAYLRHNEMFAKLHLLARGRAYDKSKPESQDFLRLEANAAFVGAAVVVCASLFFRLKSRLVKTLPAQLAKLIDMSATDVNVMANILFTYAFDEEKFKAIHQRQGKHGD